MATCVVTGGNRGIGEEVVRQLALGGHSVILVARDEAAGQRVARQLGPAVEAVRGDLSSVSETRALAERIVERCPRIDVLVHNAGVWPARCERNDDGIERAFAVNHLAPFVLNHALGSLLPPGGRIVQVTAGLYVKGKVDLERTPRGDDFHLLWTYATTKLCNLLLLERWAARFRDRGVTVNAVHPGVVRTGLGDRAGALGWVVRLAKRRWKPVTEGAPPIVRLAFDPALADVTGAYFDELRRAELAPPATDRALADRVWEQATKLARIESA